MSEQGPRLPHVPPAGYRLPRRVGPLLPPVAQEPRMPTRTPEQDPTQVERRPELAPDDYAEVLIIVKMKEGIQPRDFLIKIGAIPVIIVKFIAWVDEYERGVVLAFRGTGNEFRLLQDQLYVAGARDLTTIFVLLQRNT